jgi:hypothetical protein
MSILKTIFGSGDVVGKGIDLIDSFHTSDTEMIEAKTEAKVKYLQAYAPFKIAQRVLAAMFATAFLGTFVLVMVMTLGSWGNTTEVKSVMDEFYVGEIMLTIIGFYFGGGFLEGTIQAAKKGK